MCSFFSYKKGLDNIFMAAKDVDGIFDGVFKNRKIKT
jgi:hypothetical protein